MSEHRFKFDKGQTVEAVIRGKIHQRRDNLNEPNSYVLEIMAKGGSYYRTFREHELSALFDAGGIPARTNDNVVHLQVAV